jgi:hypothetical protein
VRTAAPTSLALHVPHTHSPIQRAVDVRPRAVAIKSPGARLNGARAGSNVPPALAATQLNGARAAAG